MAPLRRPRFGIYKSPAFTAPDMVVLHLWLAVWAAFRGSDYSWRFGETHTLAELAFAPSVWVAMCWAVSGAIFIGLAGRLHCLVWGGHSLGLAMNLGLSVGALLVAMERSGQELTDAALPTVVWVVFVVALAVIPLAAAVWGARTGRRIRRISRVTVAVAACTALIIALGPVWSLDGGRAVGPIATMALLHGMLAIRMSPHPVRPDDRGARVDAVTTSTGVTP